MMHRKMHNLQSTDSRWSATRAGFSLIEIIMVVAIMVAIAAMMTPAMAEFFGAQKLAKSADQIRSEMGRARVEAIRTGDVMAFYFTPEMTSYTVAPFSESFEEQRNQESAGVDERSSDFNFTQERLPRGVIFAAADSPPDARVTQTMMENEVSLSRMRPILFYPDGTSQNAAIILKNEKNDLYKITLRGLTGSTSAAPYADEGQ
jgi:prepilin-type N-terminal cleavage/methylation domain-containing protein